MKQRIWSGAITTLLVSVVSAANAEELTVTVNAINSDGVGAEMGTVQLIDSEHGLILKPLIKGLSPGAHGWHVHENPDCGPAERDGQMVAGLAAGGHYDPENTGKHGGPSGDGHLGDLPRLYVPVDEGAVVNTVKNPVIAPRLKLADIRGRTIVIHEGGDNYRDTPEPNGGGGGRVACAVIPQS